MTAKGAKSDPVQDSRKPRNIVLFSDGTGNSSAKLQKTNVWRLYEALDLGESGDGAKAEQIAYYDNGVGTSSFQLFAVLGGVFGFGLARNIRNIYKFLCRNYQPGDRIYAFGFSRGAYTIRLLIAMVCMFGVVEYATESQLDLAARDVWRQSRRGFHTNFRFTDFLVSLNRAFRRACTRIKRRAFHEPSSDRYMPEPGLWWFQEWKRYWSKRDAAAAAADHARKIQFLPGMHQVEIEFVGVWDTVSAYGGPFVELTRAFDWWIWPLTMPHYGLHQSVKLARHALAIDDKRDAFHPLLWDEVREREVPAEARTAVDQARARGAGEQELAFRESQSVRLENHDMAAKPRLKQVWFAGMHSDVGGGYADDSLSHVSLVWMIDQIKPIGVHLIDLFEERIRKFANVLGPLHDSRGGAAALYRYQPRYINAWIDHPQSIAWDTCYPASRVWSHLQPATQIFRDPTIDRERFETRGLLVAPISLHASVESRLLTATDGYGPNNLPGWYRLEGGPGDRSDPPYAHNPAPQIAAARLEAELLLGDRIKLRRFWYFVTIALGVLLALRPYWSQLGALSTIAGSVDDRTNAQLIEALVGSFLPPFLKSWLHAIFADLFTSLLLIGLIVVTMTLGTSQEGAMVDISRAVWSSRFDNRAPAFDRPGRFTRSAFVVARYVHKSDELQQVLALIKWRVVPWLLGGVVWLAITYAVAAGLTQFMLLGAEIQPEACVSKQGRGALIGAAPISFPRTGNDRTAAIDAGEHCGDTGIRVAAGKKYKIAIEILDNNGVPVTHWQDGSQHATPQGWVNPHGTDVAVELSSKYFRRLVAAPLFAPILDFRPDSDGVPAAGTTRLVPTHMVWPKLQQSADPAYPNLWEGEFTTPGEQSRTFRLGARDGQRQARLYIFLNDVKLFTWWFYGNNQGRFRVCVWAAEQPFTAQDCGGFVDLQGKSPGPAQ